MSVCQSTPIHGQVRRVAPPTYTVTIISTSLLHAKGHTHQFGKSIAFPLAPNTAKLRMNKITWLPPSSAADVR